MLKTEELNLFVAVIEAQSITAGAEKLGLPKSNVSRRLKQLEETLQVKLIERTSRLFKPVQYFIKLPSIFCNAPKAQRSSEQAANSTFGTPAHLCSNDRANFTGRHSLPSMAP